MAGRSEQTAKRTPTPLLGNGTRLHRQSLGSQIATKLREEIVMGRLPAGTLVSQQRLCEEYGTSRMPVRDGLLKLTHEGLIENTPGGHYVVGRLTIEDLADAFEIEAVVHGRAARRATLNATEAEIDELDGLHAAMVEAERGGNLDRVADLHWRFHKRVNQLARSPKLLAFIRNASVGIPHAFLAELPDWAPRANKEHAKIVRALRKRDATKVEALMRSLIEDSGADLVAYLQRNRMLGSRESAD
jgi:DNA-binding GntR family transcriptional regulator